MSWELMHQSSPVLYLFMYDQSLDVTQTSFVWCLSYIEPPKYCLESYGSKFESFKDQGGIKDKC